MPDSECSCTELPPHTSTEHSVSGMDHGLLSWSLEIFKPFWGKGKGKKDLVNSLHWHLKHSCD